MSEENKTVELKEEDLKKITGGSGTEASFSSLKEGDCLIKKDYTVIIKVWEIRGNTIEVQTADPVYGLGLGASSWAWLRTTIDASEVSNYYKCKIDNSSRLVTIL